MWTRRQFLAQALAIGATLAYNARNSRYLKMVNGLITGIEADNKETKALYECLAFIKERYGLDVYNGENKLLNAVHPDSLNLLEVTGTAVPRELLYAALIEILDGLHYYPADFFKNNNINSIRLMQELKLNSEPRGGAVVSLGSVSLSVSSFFVEHEPESFRSAFHHEIFHCLQQTIAGMQILPAWNKLPINEGAMISPEYMNQTQQAILIEDPAYLAGIVMDMIRHRIFLYRILNESDPAVQQILSRKKALVEEVYLKASGGKMDYRYWVALLQGKIDANYFA